jgi:hypothetical protein
MKLDDWNRATKPTKNGLYERLYADHLSPSIEEYRDGIWFNVTTGRSASMQGKPWRPIKVKEQA